MIEALIDGERRGQVLAELAKGKMRAKIPDLSMALEGRFGEHHALMCRLHLDHTGHLEAMTTALDAQIEAMMTPFRAARDLLTTAPGIGPLSAAAVISEIGVTVREFFPDASAYIVYGIHASVRPSGWVPVNRGGATPMIVKRPVPIASCWPTICASPANRDRHSASLITTTGCAPRGSSSSGMMTRPRAARMPSTEK